LLSSVFSFALKLPPQLPIAPPSTGSNSLSKMSFENDNSNFASNIQHEMFRLQDEVNEVFLDCVGTAAEGKYHGECGHPLVKAERFGMVHPRHRGRFVAPINQFQFPLLSVKDEQNQLIIFADLPGVRKDNVKLEVSQGRLTISGTRQREMNDQNSSWFMDERFFGNFTRSIRLPKRVNENQISARLMDGVLQISIPTEVVASKAITIA